MRTLYLDCSMGAAGDMLTAALLELFPDQQQWLARLNALQIPDVEFIAEKAEKCGIVGTQMHVRIHDCEEGEAHSSHTHTHTHTGREDIFRIVSQLPVSERVRADIRAVFDSIADAESRVHGVPVTQIHFHEVGSMDAIADVTAVCVLLEALDVQQVICSPVHVGSGTVHCSHGELPVPAPATALLLRGIPMYSGEIDGELCTPTGAALLRHFAVEFSSIPEICVEQIGYGMGHKDFARANCVRAFLGQTRQNAEDVCVLSCNLDDMTGEDIGFALEKLLQSGALDAYTLPVQAKKSRPAILLQTICRPQDKEKICAVLFAHTSTLGVRESIMRRYTLQRASASICTPWGDVRLKTADGYGTVREKWEYEDLRRIADAHNLTLAQVRARLLDFQSKE